MAIPFRVLNHNDDGVCLQTPLRIKFEVPFEVVCTVPKKPFGGVVDVKYTPKVGMETTLIEFNTFKSWIESLRSKEFTAEGLTEHILHHVVTAVDPVSATVILRITSMFHVPAVISATYSKPTVGELQ